MASLPRSGGGLKRSADALESHSTLTDEQLDKLLPSDGFEIVAPPAGGGSGGTDSGGSGGGDNGSGGGGGSGSGGGNESSPEPVFMSAEQVHAYFVAAIGPPEEAFEKMRKMKIADLEDLQAVADEIAAAGASAEAQHAGLEWSTRISTVIA